MRFTFPAGLKRGITDVDLSDVTSAQIVGDPIWEDATSVDIPFSRDLSSAEVQAISLRLSTTSPVQEDLMKEIGRFLALGDASDLDDMRALMTRFAQFYAGGSL